MLGGGAHHDAAHVPVAGVEDVVEALLEDLGRLLDAAFHHLDAGLVDVFRELACQERRRVRRDLGWLDEGRVARGDRRAERRHEELEGIVPGRDDQHDAKRLAQDETASGMRDERGRHPLGLGPFAEVLAHVRRVVGDEGDLRAVRLQLGLAEVGVERGGDVVLALLGEPLDALELPDPPGHRAGESCVEALPQRQDDVRDVLGGRAWGGFG